MRAAKHIISLLLITIILISMFSVAVIPAGAYASEYSGKTVSEVLGMDPNIYLKWLSDHDSDGYYLGTPYGDGDYRNPRGDCRGRNGRSDEPGEAAMNCTGFVWHVLYQATRASGGRTSMIPALGRQYWLDFYENDQSIQRCYFSSKSEMLNSGYLSKGDIIWMFVDGEEYTPKDEHHVGIYYGDGHSDRMWHSSDNTGTNTQGNVIATIRPKEDYNTKYMVLKIGSQPIVKIAKSSDTPLTSNGNSNYSFKGIKYCFYKSKNYNYVANSSNPDYLGFVELNRNGVGLSSEGSRDALRKIRPGTYYVREYNDTTLQNSGYKYNDSVYTITVRENNTVLNPLVVNVSDTPQKPNIKIVKSSSNTYTTNGNNNYSLKGIRYCVYKSKNSDTVGNSNPDYLGYIELDENGIGYSSDGSRDDLRNLGYGTYYVKEFDDAIRRASGYALDDTFHTVKLTKEYTATNPYVLYLQDEPERPVLKIKKSSSIPEATNGNSNYSLKGITYCVYKSADNFGISNNPNYLGYIELDEYGIGYSTKGSRIGLRNLGYGTYYIKEDNDKARKSSGYKLDENYYTVELTKDYSETNLYVLNLQDEPELPAFKIEKSSTKPELTDGNSNYSFKGLTYCVFKSMNSDVPGSSNPDYVGYIELDENGEGYSFNGSRSGLRNLGYGTYYIKEFENAARQGSGYKLDEKYYTVNLTNSYSRTNPLVLKVKDEPEGITGARIIKRSSDPDLTEGNNCYSLSGAKFNVYGKHQDAVNDNNPLFTNITTDENGVAYIDEIAPGKYYVREMVAPKGFKLSNEIGELDVLSNSESTAEAIITDQPLTDPVEVLLQKRNATTGEVGEELNGAEYEFRFYNGYYATEDDLNGAIPERTWIFRTDNNGKITYDDRHLVSGDSLYEDGQFPLGTVTVQEIKAPTEPIPFYLDDTLYIIPIHASDDNVVHSYNFPVSNEYEKPMTDIRGTKTWVDNNNANGNRPGEITVNLIKTVNGVSTTVATTTTNASKNWKYEFTRQPVYEDVDGTDQEIAYSVEEEPVADYETSYDGLNIINTEKHTNLIVNKVWNDNNNQDGVRPQEVVVKLYADNSYTRLSVTISEQDDWTKSFTDLPIKKNGHIINYTVVEESINVSEGSYTPSISAISGDPDTGYSYTITNVHEPVKTSVTVKKKWTDFDDLEGFRPISIQVKLSGYENGIKITQTAAVTMTSYGNATSDPNVWSYTFTDLQKYSNGHLIDYVATELSLINGYNLDENGNPQTINAPLERQEDGSYACVLENTHVLRLTDITVNKIWEDDNNRDGLRPNSITVYLVTVDESGTKTRYKDKNGNDVVGVLQAADNWTWTFSNIPVYNSDQQIIEYSVEESIPTGYTATYAGNAADGFTITNTHHEITSVTVNKVWDDQNNQDGIRPSSIVINLLANGSEFDEVELSDENNWEYTFNDLPVNRDGRAIKYSVTEDSISVPSEFSSDGYSVRYSNMRGSAQTGYSITVTNQHTPKIRSIDVSKIWNDQNNHDGIRPSQVEVSLFVTSPSNTGIPTKYGYLSEENDWHYTFENLPKYFNGQLIQYSVDETDIVITASSNGYIKRIQGDMNTGFTITNSHRNEKIKLIIDKVWEDDDNLNHTRPDYAEFEVTGEQGQVTTVVLNDANNWHYEVRYDKYYDGVEQVPDVKEIHLAEGYVSRKTVERSNKSYTTTYQFTVTNTYEPEPTTIPVRKIWADNTYGEDFGVIVELHRRPVGQTTDTYIDNLVLTSYNDWQGEFEGLFPRYVDGVECEYYLQEYVLDCSYFEDGEYIWYDNEFEYRNNTSTLFLDDYTAEITGNNIEGYVIVNTSNDYAKMDIPFVKVWEDGDNADGIRPSTIDVVLTGYVGGYAYEGNFDSSSVAITRHAVVKATDGWKYTFEDLPALCTDANIVGTIDDYADSYEYTDARLIYYTVEEIIPSGYTQKISMQSHYLHDKEEYYHDVYSNSYKHPQEQLYRYLTIPECRRAKTEHNDFIYWLSHNSISPSQIAHGGGYRYDMNLGLVNEYAPITTSIKVDKTWEDNNNQDGVRPNSLTVNLLANGVKVKEATLNEQNNWSYTFSNLPVNDNGQPISYSMTEESFETPAGFEDYEAYPVEVEGNNVDGWKYSFTNYYEPQLTNVSVAKRWQDNKNLYGFRPSELLIILKADGEAIQTHSLTEAEADPNASTSNYDVWKYTFNNLPKYKNGTAIQYTVEEQLTDNDEIFYKNTRTTSSSDNNGNKTFTITNKNKTATVTIQKKNENGTLIGGSVFKLFLLDGTPLKLTELFEGRYLYSPNSATSDNTITLTAGKADITELPPNVVIIAKEVTAPNRYSPHADDIVINAPLSIKENGLSDDRSGVYTIPAIDVNNYKTIMPATGGKGDFAIYLLAVLSLIGSIVFLIKKRKKDDEV